MKPFEIYEGASQPGAVYLVNGTVTNQKWFASRAEAEADRAASLAFYEEEITDMQRKVEAIKAQIAFEALPEYAAGMKDGNPVFYKRGKKSWWLAPGGTDPKAWNDYWKVSGEAAAALIAWVEA